MDRRDFNKRIISGFFISTAWTIGLIPIAEAKYPSEIRLSMAQLNVASPELIINGIISQASEMFNSSGIRTTIFLPAGTILIGSPIILKPGVDLSGVGAGTIINNASAGMQPAIVALRTQLDTSKNRWRLAA